MNRRSPWFRATGDLLNTVTHPMYPCPQCGNDGPMQVWRDRTVRKCGHVRALPPLDSKHSPRSPHRARPQRTTA